MWENHFSERQKHISQSCNSPRRPTRGWVGPSRRGIWPPSARRPAWGWVGPSRQGGPAPQPPKVRMGLGGAIEAGGVRRLSPRRPAGAGWSHRSKRDPVPQPPKDPPLPPGGSPFPRRDPPYLPRRPLLGNPKSCSWNSPVVCGTPHSCAFQQISQAPYQIFCVLASPAANGVQNA